MALPHVEIFTDGACRGNPGPGGWAYLLRFGPHEKLASGGSPATTNNQMELQAVIAALNALTKPCRVDLYTDSQYVQKGIKEWLAQWQKNGWKTSSKQAVKNQEYWQALVQATTSHEIHWHWVRGHAGHPENERVDAAARAAIAKACKQE